jgi:hypothetical protein
MNDMIEKSKARALTRLAQRGGVETPGHQRHPVRLDATERWAGAV